MLGVPDDVLGAFDECHGGIALLPPNSATDDDLQARHAALNAFVALLLVGGPSL